MLLIRFFLCRVCATGALRIHYAHRVYYYTQISPSPTYDISWEALGSWVSTAVEANVAIICASAPALNAYFKGWFGVTMGYQERDFGWYNRSRRWSPWSSARRDVEVEEGDSRSTPLGCLSYKGGEMEVIDAVRVPSRAYVSRERKSARDGGGSVGSGETLGRQDSIAPILRGG